MADMNDKELQAAFEGVRQDSEEAKKFVADPEAYLQAKGIDTEGLRFGEVDRELADSDLEMAAGGLMAPRVCTIVGTGTGVTSCVSVGDEV